MTFEGNTKKTRQSEKDKVKSVFGNTKRGESLDPSSRQLVRESRNIGGVNVPAKPLPPDNCCMLGCVNCVWVLFNEDIAKWKLKRLEAVEAIKGTGIIWPADFNPPLRYLDMANIPLKLRKKALSENQNKESKRRFQFPPRYSSKQKSVSGSQAQSLRAEKQEETSDKENEWDNIPTVIKVFAEFEKSKQKQR